MNSTPYVTEMFTTLDISRETKELKAAIEQKEKQYRHLLSKIEHIRHEISDFQVVYDRKIKRLYKKLNALEQLLFKYRNISEHVDDLFSFSEAEKIFDDMYGQQQARIEEECNKNFRNPDNRGRHISEAKRQELKRIYRKLARAYHPDQTGGDDSMMKRINRFYKEEDLASLKNIELERDAHYSDNTLVGLSKRFMVLGIQIENATKEIALLQTSDMYVLRKNLLRRNKTNTMSMFDTLAKKLRKDIHLKEEQLNEYLVKFGVNKDMRDI